MPESAPAIRSEAGWGDYIRRCASRDESALAALYDESSNLAYSIALRILADEADASEVMLDVFRQVWDGAAKFDERRGSAAAWIVVLARSRAIDRRRSRTAKNPAADKIEEAGDVRSQEPSPETIAMASQTSRSMMFALSSIPAEQRTALELAFFGGLSHSEVAERLGEPLGTVKTRIRLAIHRLRELLRTSV